MSDGLVFERIKDTMVNCQGFPADLITAEATIDSLGGDSVDDVELATLRESEFAIEIHDGSFDVNTTIGEIAKRIEGIINK